MRGNGNILGPQNNARGGVWGVDDQKLSGVILPILEANANPDTFVLNIKGAAGASETGVGGGLTGANLVFTPFGNPPGVVSGFRQFDGVNHYFTCTGPFIDNFFKGTEHTLMHRIKDQVGGKYLFYLGDTGSTQFMNSASSMGGGVQCFVPQTPMFATVTNISPFFLPDNWDGWYAQWLKNGIFHCGVKLGDAQPTGWDSFDSDKRQFALNCGRFITVNAWSLMSIIGYSGGKPNMKIGTVVASKLGLPAVVI